MLDSLEKQPSFATRHGKGRSKQTQVEIVPVERLGEGFYGVVWRVTTIIKNVFNGSAGDKERTLAHKYYRHTEDVAGAFAMYKHLNDPAFPALKVVPTMRKVEGGLLMTDLSEGGKNLVISKNEIGLVEQSAYIEYLISEKPEMAKLLAEIDITKLKGMIKPIAEALAAKRIRATWDTFFLVFKPSGEFEIYEGDFDIVTLYERHANVTLERAKYGISGYVDLVEEFIQNLRKKLWTQGGSNP